MKIIGLGPGSGRHVMPLICKNRCRPLVSLSLSILYIESRDKCVTADAEHPHGTHGRLRPTVSICLLNYARSYWE